MSPGLLDEKNSRTLCDPLFLDWSWLEIELCLVCPQPAPIVDIACLPLSPNKLDLKWRSTLFARAAVVKNLAFSQHHQPFIEPDGSRLPIIHLSFLCLPAATTV